MLCVWQVQLDVRDEDDHTPLLLAVALACEALPCQAADGVAGLTKRAKMLVQAGGRQGAEKLLQALPGGQARVLRRASAGCRVAGPARVCPDR